MTSLSANTTFFFFFPERVKHFKTHQTHQDLRPVAPETPFGVLFWKKRDKHSWGRWRECPILLWEKGTCWTTFTFIQNPCAKASTLPAPQANRDWWPQKRSSLLPDRLFGKGRGLQQLWHSSSLQHPCTPSTAKKNPQLSSMLFFSRCK